MSLHACMKIYNKELTFFPFSWTFHALPKIIKHWKYLKVKITKFPPKKKKTNQKFCFPDLHPTSCLCFHHRSTLLSTCCKFRVFCCCWIVFFKCVVVFHPLLCVLELFYICIDTHYSSLFNFSLVALFVLEGVMTSVL